ncbi:MAG: aromatic aminobenezylarsenical efflux permease ArsG family transporter [Alphaproteobacteria bacterium]
MDNVALFGVSLWLGILTAISPCPLAANIAAVSFIGKKITKPYLVFISGVFYTLGRALAYILIGFFIVKSIIGSQILALNLQLYMNSILGPLMIITGLVILDILRLPFPNLGAGNKLQKVVEKMGLLGCVLLGFVFALSFCPVSTALFFGGLIPIAIEHKSSFFIPAVYGVATGIPVLIFAFVIAFSTKKLGLIFNKVSVFEQYARKITGVIFIITGAYFVYYYILN